MNKIDALKSIREKIDNKIKEIETRLFIESNNNNYSIDEINIIEQQIKQQIKQKFTYL